MNTNLKRVAGEIMNEQQEFEIYKLLGNGKVELAKDYLLGRVDSLYCRYEMDLQKAAYYYSIIDPIPERARMFPQVT